MGKKLFGVKIPNYSLKYLNTNECVLIFDSMLLCIKYESEYKYTRIKFIQIYINLYLILISTNTYKVKCCFNNKS